ncbi:MAG TPA: hypothetical protein VLH79_13695 [Chthonomonadales bacterium]|nr:hypothetical protein [Chthonomonadales bacterium]
MTRERPRCRRSGALASVWCIALAGGLLLPLPSFARSEQRQPSAADIVRRYLAAQRTVALRGTAVVVSPGPGGVTTSMRRIVRGPNGSTLTTILTPRSQRGTVALNDGTWSIAYEPAERLVKVKRAAPRCAATNARRARRVLANFTAVVEDQVPLAGRTCYRVRLTPRAGDGCIVTLWIDRRTGAELGREESDRRGNTQSLMLFTEVSFPRRVSPSELAFRQPRGVRRVNIDRTSYSRSLATLTAAARFPVVAPLTVPAGYEFECGHVVRVNGQDTAVLRYSNGLANLTICQTESSAPAPVGAMRLARGENVVAVSRGRRHVLVFGHHSAAALYAVAGSIDPKLSSAFGNHIASQFRVARSVVGSLRDRGFTAEGVVVALTAQQRTRRPLPDFAALHDQGWGWRDLANRFGISQRDVAQQVAAFHASWRQRP